MSYGKPRQDLHLAVRCGTRACKYRYCTLRGRKTAGKCQSDSPPLKTNRRDTSGPTSATQAQHRQVSAKEGKRRTGGRSVRFDSIRSSKQAINQLIILQYGRSSLRLLLDFSHWTPVLGVRECVERSFATCPPLVDEPHRSLPLLAVVSLILYIIVVCAVPIRPELYPPNLGNPNTVVYCPVL